jgi:uncharacterized repeat protein (TIGR03837 family)
MSSAPLKTWDIFCRVIDNYGDIGVCWRLARQLAQEYPFQVRLWVDEITVLAQIWPSVTQVEQQCIEQVDIRIWQHEFNAVEPADVVIEAFACDLPAIYLTAMKRQPAAPHWFNLEYLSAEEWVEGCHGLLSVHPQLGLKKAFFFPGFTGKTGGLLKEKFLLNERDGFMADAANRTQFLQSLGVKHSGDELIISLFGYDNKAVGSLLEAWMQSPTPVLCLVPPGKILPSINAHIGISLAVGEEFARGSLRLQVIPFLIQTDYDRLLWTCDLNFIRGEDSFARAQWAAKPFIWHIYAQDDDVHIIKLDAFLQLYLTGVKPELQASITELWHQWNRGSDCRQSWLTCLADVKSWQKHSGNWCHSLNSLGDLASNMVQFCQKTL